MHPPVSADDRSARVALATETRHSAMLLVAALGGMGGFAATLLMVTTRLAG